MQIDNDKEHQLGGGQSDWIHNDGFTFLRSSQSLGAQGPNFPACFSFQDGGSSSAALKRKNDFSQALRTWRHGFSPFSRNFSPSLDVRNLRLAMTSRQRCSQSKAERSTDGRDLPTAAQFESSLWGVSKSARLWPYFLRPILSILAAIENKCPNGCFSSVSTSGEQTSETYSPKLCAGIWERG